MTRRAQYVPVVFVLLWSTGFIGAKFGLPYASPFTFLALRMALNVVLFLALLFIFRKHLPNAKACRDLLVAGLLIHGCYLGGVFYAIDHGMATGLSSLLVGLQPILTALLAIPWLGERLNRRQWLGLIIGLVGISIVLSTRTGGSFHFDWQSLVASAIALLGITIGTLYQKKFCTHIDLLPATFIQYAGSFAAFTLLALLLEDTSVQWHLQFIGALAWLTLVLSMLAVLLLLYMLRTGEASKVASLFYLTPAVTAVQGYIWFDEQLPLQIIIGGAITVIAVFLVTHSSGKTA